MGADVARGSLTIKTIGISAYPTAQKTAGRSVVWPPGFSSSAYALGFIIANIGKYAAQGQWSRAFLARRMRCTDATSRRPSGWVT